VALATVDLDAGRAYDVQTARGGRWHAESVARAKASQRAAKAGHEANVRPIIDEIKRSGAVTLRAIAERIDVGPELGNDERDTLTLDEARRLKCAIAVAKLDRLAQQRPTLKRRLEL
jgi:hypothetical protein